MSAERVPSTQAVGLTPSATTALVGPLLRGRQHQKRQSLGLKSISAGGLEAGMEMGEAGLSLYTCFLQPLPQQAFPCRWYLTVYT